MRALLAALPFLSLWIPLQALGQLTAYQSCAFELEFPSVMPGVAGMETRFVQPDKLDLEQKRRLVACADAKKNVELSDYLDRVLADDIAAGRVPAPIRLAEKAAPPERRLPTDGESAATWYGACAAFHKFPKTSTGEWVQPRELRLAQKKQLIECGNMWGVPAFVSWVNSQVADDIKRGYLRAAEEHRLVQGGQRPPAIVRVVPFVVLMIMIGTAVSLMLYARRKEASVGTAPKFLAVAGLALTLAPRLGLVDSWVFALLVGGLGLILLAVAAVWAFIRIRYFHS